jgi:hypothetical protein
MKQPLNAGGLAGEAKPIFEREWKKAALTTG